MESYEEIVMQVVSQLMVKAMTEQRISDEKVSALTDELVEISQKVMAATLDAEIRTTLDRYDETEKDKLYMDEGYGINDLALHMKTLKSSLVCMSRL